MDVIHGGQAANRGSNLAEKAAGMGTRNTSALLDVEPVSVQTIQHVSDTASSLSGGILIFRCM
jgi:hypothetical protein